MNFGPLFVNWIQMLHEGATTCFILDSLTASILVSFSIRQGDPLAMLLYIIYIEPLLNMLERKLTGLQLRRRIDAMGGLEAYCDDINIVTNNLNDFNIMDVEVSKFERLSGAILSRSRKSKVMGFGGWRDKRDWPIPWLSVEKTIKVFGIFIADNYNEMLRVNWDHRFRKCQSSIFSWTSRLFTTLHQRAEIVKTFALSRVYYVASILPIRVSYVRKFEALIGNFLWKGSFSTLRVAYDELKNKKLEGGLQVPCLLTMSRSLLTSQCIRLIKSGDPRYVSHIDYWLGGLLCDIVPDMGLGLQASRDNPYFCSLGDCVASVIANGILSGASIRTVTNKQIYYNSAEFPLPKVVRELPPGINYKSVWERLYSPYINAEERQILYLLIHDKLPVPERLYRISIKNDPYCTACPGAEIGVKEHFFCRCTRTVTAWNWLRSKLLHLSNDIVTVSNTDLLHLFIPRGIHLQAIIWLLSKYVLFAWSTIFVQETDVKLEKFIGYLKFKFKSEHCITTLTARTLDNILQ